MATTDFARSYVRKRLILALALSAVEEHGPATLPDLWSAYQDAHAPNSHPIGYVDMRGALLELERMGRAKKDGEAWRS